MKRPAAALRARPAASEAASEGVDGAAVDPSTPQKLSGLQLALLPQMTLEAPMLMSGSPARPFLWCPLCLPARFCLQSAASAFCSVCRCLPLPLLSACPCSLPHACPCSLPANALLLCFMLAAASRLCKLPLKTCLRPSLSLMQEKLDLVKGKDAQSLVDDEVFNEAEMKNLWGQFTTFRQSASCSPEPGASRHRRQSEQQNQSSSEIAETEKCRGRSRQQRQAAEADAPAE